jgi:HlyD family secretion protein
LDRASGQSPRHERQGGQTVKKLLILLVIVGVALVAGAYWFYPSSRDHHVEFTTASAEYGTLVDTISPTGQVKWKDLAAVVAKVPGEVIEIRADINQDVKKDDELVRLRNDDITNKLEQAEAAVETANAAVEAAEAKVKGAQEVVKYEESLVKGVRIEANYLKAQYDVLTARASRTMAKAERRRANVVLAGAKLAVERLHVRAPISGTIIDKKVLIGQPVGMVAAASAGGGAREISLGGSSAFDGGGGIGAGPLFVIAKGMSTVDVHAQVTETDIGNVLPGQRAVFTVYAYGDDVKFDGTVKKKHPLPISVQGTAVFYDTVVEAGNRWNKRAREWMLLPGMTAAVDIIRREHHQVWKMPVAALDFQLDEAYQTPEAEQKLKEWQNKPNSGDWQRVWVVRNDKPWPLFIRTGGVDAAGQTGISDGKYKQVLQWDPDLEAKPNPKDKATWPQAIIAAPPVHKGGFLDQPTKFKFS